MSRILFYLKKVLLFALLTGSVASLVSCDGILAFSVNGARMNPNGGKNDSDGSQESPVNLILGVAFSGKIGNRNSACSTSYYKFTPTESGIYDVMVAAGNDPISVEIDSCLDNCYRTEPNDGHCIGQLSKPILSKKALAAGSTLYFRLRSNDDVKATYTIIAVSHVSSGDGSVSSPVKLLIDTTLSTKASSASANEDSYYVVSPSVSGNYELKVSEISAVASIVFTWGDDSTFVTYKGTGSIYHSSDPKSVIPKIWLAANTSYYIKASPSHNSPAVTFKLLMGRYFAANDGAITFPTPLAIGTPYAAKLGKAGGGDDNSYYIITPTLTGKYDVSVSGTETATKPNLWAYFGGDGTFSSYSKSGCTSGAAESKPLNSLPMMAGSSYFLRLFSQNSLDQTFTLTVSVHPTVGNGTLASPEVLTAEMPFAVSIGARDDIDGVCYFKFTPAASGGFQVYADSGSAALIRFNAYWGQSADFNAISTSKYCSWSGSSVAIGPVLLTAGTNYYLRLVSDVSDHQAFSLTVKSVN
jgi:hypothetical protein